MRKGSHSESKYRITFRKKLTFHDLLFQNKHGYFKQKPIFEDESVYLLLLLVLLLLLLSWS